MSDKRPSRRQFLTASGVALSTAMAGCAFNAPTDGTESGNGSGSESGFPDEHVPPDSDERPPAESVFSEVYRDVIPSVAAVQADNPEFSDPAGGTAWLYDNNRLVTNEHVVRGATDLFLRFQDLGWVEATLVGEDPMSDLAVLETADVPPEATPLSPVPQPRPVGTQVAAIGNPFELSGSFTTGVISGRNRTIDVPDSPFSIADGIQTDAAVNPGNSGGPLITIDGEVVGVVNAGLDGGPFNDIDNIGFAISAAMVRRVVPELIEHGEFDHSYMGILLSDVTPALIEANDFAGYTWGVYVNDVVEGEASHRRLQGSQNSTQIRGQRVGIGGDLIIRMDDWTIQDQERLSAFLALETDPGDTIEIEVVRDGETRTVDVTLGERPDPDEEL